MKFRIEICWLEVGIHDVIHKEYLEGPLAAEREPLKRAYLEN